MTPPAPALFSTNTGTPRACASGCDSRRPIWSVAPPGGQGTRILIGLSGQAARAVVADKASSAPAKRVRVMRATEFVGVMVSSSIRHCRRRRKGVRARFRPAISRSGNAAVLNRDLPPFLTDRAEQRAARFLNDKGRIYSGLCHPIRPLKERAAFFE